MTQTSSGATGAQKIDVALQEIRERIEAGRPGEAIAILNEELPHLGGDARFLIGAAQLMSGINAQSRVVELTSEALELAPGDADAVRLRLSALVETGDFAAAAALLDDPMHTQDFAPAARALERARLARRQGDVARAAGLAAEAVAADPGAPAPAVLHIRCLIDIPDIEAARRALSGALARWPGNAALMLAKARLALRLGDRNAAAAALDAAETAQPGSREAALLRLEMDIGSGVGRDLASGIRPQDPGAAQILTRLGQMALRHGEVTRAEALADRALRASPRHPGALILRASCQMVENRLDAARDGIEAALSQGAAAPGIYTTLAAIEHRRGAHEAEAEALRRGLGAFPDSPVLSEYGLRRMAEEGLLDPETPDGAALLGRLPASRAHAIRVEALLQRTDFAAALEILRPAGMPRRGPDEAEKIAEALTGLRKLTLAFRYLRFCVYRWPDRRSFKVALRAACLIDDRPEPALAFFRNLRPADRRGRAHVQHELSRLCAFMGDAGKALRHHRRARALHPTGAHHNPPLLQALIARGDFETARDLVETRQREHPQQVPHWRASLHGQLYTELEVEALGSGRTRLAPGKVDNPAHSAACVRRRPQSNVAALRHVANWTRAHPAEALPAAAPVITPRRIVQYWNTDPPPDEIAAMIATWRRAPGFEYRLFSRITALAYLREAFGPRWVRAFRMANNVSEESDFLRLCALAEGGGIYADADDRLTGDLDALLAVPAGLVLYVEPMNPAIGNNFIAAKPRHPALILAANIAQRALLRRSIETTWSKTGPGLLTRAVARYLVHCESRGIRPDLAIYRRRTVSDHVAMHNPVHYKKTEAYWNANPNRRPRGDLRDVLTGR